MEHATLQLLAVIILGESTASHLSNVGAALLVVPSGLRSELYIIVLSYRCIYQLPQSINNMYGGNVTITRCKFLSVLPLLNEEVFEDFGLRKVWGGLKFKRWSQKISRSNDSRFNINYSQKQFICGALLPQAMQLVTYRYIYLFQAFVI